MKSILEEAVIPQGIINRSIKKVGDFTQTYEQATHNLNKTFRFIVNSKMPNPIYFKDYGVLREDSRLLVEIPGEKIEKSFYVHILAARRYIALRNYLKSLNIKFNIKKGWQSNPDDKRYLTGLVFQIESDLNAINFEKTTDFKIIYSTSYKFGITKSISNSLEWEVKIPYSSWATGLEFTRSLNSRIEEFQKENIK